MVRADGTLATPVRLALAAVVLIGFVLAIADAFTILFYGSYIAVGALLAIRRPRNAVSWLLVGIAFALLGTTIPQRFDVPALLAGGGSLADRAALWIRAWIAIALFLGFAALTFIFPSGQLPKGRWGRTAIVLLAVGGLICVATMLEPIVTVSVAGGSVNLPNPLGLLPDGPFWPIITGASYAVPLAALTAAVINMLVRYRGSDEQTRLQLRWLLASMAFVLIGIVFALSVFAIRGDDAGGLAWILVIGAYPTVPLAVGVAVLRYRLYQIDRIVNRALVYGAMTAILGGVFAAATALSQRLFIAFAGQTSDAAIVLTTLVVVTAYGPLRKRVESVVDRYFKYDQREYGPYLADLRRLRELIEPTLAARRLATEAMAQTGAVGVAVVGATSTILASAGTWPAEPNIEVPIAVTGSDLATVLLGPRSDGKPHAAARLRALAEIGTVAADTARVGAHLK